MRGCSILLMLAAWLLSGHAAAQLSETDTARWGFNASFTGRLNKGNVERLILTPEANLTHLGKGWGCSLGQRFTYGTFGTALTETDLLSRNFLYLHPARRLYPFVMGWFNTHRGQALRFRYQSGLGMTYVPLKRQRQLFKLSLTGTYEESFYRESGLTYLADTAASQYRTFRATLRLAGNHSFTGTALQVYYDGYFQQSLQQADNWRIFAEGGFNVRIWGGLGIKTFLTYEYQTVHVYRQKPYDLVLNTGISYRIASGR